jgi:hypothetical protein
MSTRHAEHSPCVKQASRNFSSMPKNTLSLRERVGVRGSRTSNQLFSTIEKYPLILVFSRREKEVWFSAAC